MDLDMSTIDTPKSIAWQNRKLIFITVVLYTCFCVSCAVVPGSIRFGPSLCFAFIFSMIQMIQVTLFMQREGVLREVMMCTTLCAAAILPSMQIYIVTQMGYSEERGNLFDYAYMFKEIALHITIRYIGTKTDYLTKGHSTLVVWSWIVIETFVYIDQRRGMYPILGNSVEVARRTPHFIMAFITLVIAS